MDKVYVGKVVATHGIKGEIRIVSDFPFKEKVFFIGNSILIDDKEFIITSYRVHKKYDMVTLDGYNDINDVMFLMKKSVYILKDNLKLNDDQVLDEELINFVVKTKDGMEGKIIEIFEASPSNKILRIDIGREVLIPMNSPMVLDINKKEKYIVIELIEGM